MNSDLPKVAVPVADRPMVAWVVDAVKAIGADPIVLVVGYQQEVVREIFSGQSGIEFVEQKEQLGTANAVNCTYSVLKDFDGDVIVLAGDGPLIRKATLQKLVDRHRSTSALATLATSVVQDPTGYGRIVRNTDGNFLAIVEEKVATDSQRIITEINPSYYCLDCQTLFETLAKVKHNEQSGEFYLTDVPGILQQEGKRVEVIDAVPPEDVLSINTEAQRAEVDAILSARLEGCR